MGEHAFKTSQFVEMCLYFQMRYKEAGKKGVSSSLYSLLPETLETAHAKEVSELLSEVRNQPERHLRGWTSAASWLFFWPNQVESDENRSCHIHDVHLEQL